MDSYLTTINVITTALAIGFIGATIYYMTREPKKPKYCRPTPYHDIGYVRTIFIYPVKSLGPIEVNEAQYNDKGLFKDQLRDGSFFLIDNDNKLVTLRKEPKLILLKLERSKSGKAIKILAPNGDSIKIGLTCTGLLEKINTRIWSDEDEGVDCGIESTRFFSNYLNKPNIRLMRYPHELDLSKSSQIYFGGHLKKQPSVKVLYSDSKPIFVVNTTAINILNTMLDDEDADHVTYENFRPSVVIDADGFGETFLHKIIIGTNIWKRVRKVKHFRLEMINPETGELSDEPMKTLRKKFLKSPVTPEYVGSLMGFYCIPNESGTIQVGDEVKSCFKYDISFAPLYDT